MVLEVALLDVTDSEGFAAGYLEARSFPAGADGCRSVRMTHGIESPQRFVLLIEWDSVEAHEDFRRSEQFQAWRAKIGPFFAQPPLVEHFTDVG